jgi:glycine hydroxymethyltransferase
MVTKKGLDRDPDLGNKVDKAVFPGLQGGPHDHTTAGIAVALGLALRPEFKEYARQIVRNAKALSQRLTNNGVKVVSGGTDNHLLLLDLTPFGKGKGVFLQEALECAAITVNKNTIPAEPSSPFYPSGIRLGTPALTTRGMKEPEMERIADWIAAIIDETKGEALPEDKLERREAVDRFRTRARNNTRIGEIREQVIALCKHFPLYPELRVS